MPMRLAGILIVIFSACAWSAAQAVDPEERAARAAARQSFMRMINVDALVDNYTRFLGRKYDLDPAQADYTKQLLKERTDTFLGRHREDLYVLVDRLFEVRGGDDIHPMELMEWGKAVLPIYEEAKNLITDGNMQWREILNDQQRKIHDEDLRLMHESFATTEEQLGRIVTGEMSPEEFRQGGRPPQRNNQMEHSPTAVSHPDQPYVPPSNLHTDDPTHLSPSAPVDIAHGPGAPRPDIHTGEFQPEPELSPEQIQQPDPVALSPAQRSRARDQRGREAAAANAGEQFESRWEAYVREFCARYQLDDEQRQRANAVLRECQDRAGHLLRTSKPELERIERELAAAKDGTTSGRSAAELTQQKTKLVEPINDVFEKQLKPRLERIPTRAQRRAAETPPAPPAAAARTPQQRQGGGAAANPGQARTEEARPERGGRRTREASKP